jgi:hypothetical protein
MQVRGLIDSGHDYESAARRRGLAYTSATGRPADDDSPPAQNLFEPPVRHPTTNQRTR